MSLAQAALTLLHRRPGRKRIAERRPGNDHKKPIESEYTIKRVVMAQRLRLVGEKDAADPMAGHCLGRLRLASKAWIDDPVSISETQYGAGERYAMLCSRHSAIMGYATGSPRSAALSMVGSGLSCRQEPEEETILQVRRDWSDAYRTLIDAGREQHRGTLVASMTYDVCLDRIPYEAMDVDKVGDLRVGLNALCRLWR